MEINPSNSVFIIDGHSMLYRAYYVFITRPLVNSKGMNTSAIFGFLRMLFRILKKFKPQYLLISFDSSVPTFRHKLYPEYKITRKKMPDDLKYQIPVLKELLSAFGITQIEKPGIESDDFIASVAVNLKKQNFNSIIVTRDKDLFQIVDNDILILYPETGKTKEDFILITPDKVKEKFGVTPSQIPDYLALVGDNSDNIPGVKGIGPVKAVKLLNQFGSLEEIYNNLNKITDISIRKKLIEHKKEAFLSKDLALLKIEENIKPDFENWKLKKPDKDKILKMFRELEIRTLLKELEWFETITEKEEKEKIKYKLITTEDEFKNLLKVLKRSEIISFDTETDSQFPVKANLAGIAFCTSPGEAYYVSLAHSDLLNQKNLKIEYVLKEIKPILEDKTKKFIGQNLKYDYIVMKKYNIEIENIYFDTMLASYIINPTQTRHNLNEIAIQYLGYKMISYKEVTKGKDSFTKVKPEIAAKYSCEDADISYKLFQVLKPKIKELQLEDLYYKIDIPLIKVLAYMEMNGVKIDTVKLKELDIKVSSELNELTAKIYKEAGIMFNINSPKQLGEILFEKLKLPVIKKGKTGYSTDVEVLMQLRGQHPIIDYLLDYRKLNKLKNTYIDTLPKMINPETGRIHTSFSQTTTATGRLASSEPNLQNIPIRDEYGKKLREAFIGEGNNLILSADYSQIELRILAHLSEDPLLMDAFQKGEDIHTRTIQEIYGLPAEKVTPDLRRIAKVINYGIIYGMSAYGLAKELGIDVKEADTFIKEYFTRYKGVKAYIDNIKKLIQKQNYVTNLFGRRRYLPDIKQASAAQKSFIIRTAINTPVQGSAADLIKLAMIEIYKEFKKRNLKSMMILQVHDELLFEVVPEEKDIVARIVKEKMEGIYPLKVPLIVDMNYGKNWAEAH